MSESFPDQNNPPCPHCGEPTTRTDRPDGAWDIVCPVHGVVGMGYRPEGADNDES